MTELWAREHESSLLLVSRHRVSEHDEINSLAIFVWAISKGRNIDPLMIQK